MTESQFQELVYYTCQRPKMYTPTGSFYEVVSFLEGLGAGSKIEGNHYHSKFTPFLKWMAGKFNKDVRFPISWQEFRNIYSSESEATEALPGLYDDYLNDVDLSK